MGEPNTAELTGLADGYVEAYNSGDLDRIAKLIADDIYLIHHNRGVEAAGRDAVMGIFAAYGESMPDKAFANRRGVSVLGPDRVLVEHTWSGTAAVDVPGWAQKGEKVTLDLATFLTFRDGQVVEYHDYG